MKNQELLFTFNKLTAMSRYLLPPTYVLGLILIFATLTRQETYIIREMPVIIVNCSGETCSENVVWQGEDREEIQKIAREKGNAIVSALFSNPQNLGIVREKAASAISFFPRQSLATSRFTSLADEAIKLAADHKTTFVSRDSYVRYVFNKQTNERTWVYRTIGTWVIEKDGVQRGKDVTLYVSFEPTSKDSRNSSHQAIIVKNMEVQID